MCPLVLLTVTHVIFEPILTQVARTSALMWRWSGAILNMISNALPGVLLLNGAASVGASLWTDRSFAWLVLLAAALAQTTAPYVIHGLSTEVYIPSKYLGFGPQA